MLSGFQRSRNSGAAALDELGAIRTLPAIASGAAGRHV
jgi:hypothetical protein